MSRSVRFVPALVLFCSAGCAGLAPTRTGFLDGYEDLVPAPEHEVGWVPDEVLLARPRAQGAPRPRPRLWIEPTLWRPADGAPELEAETAARLTAHFESCLRESLGRDFELADGPGPDTLNVRTALTDVDPSSVFVNVVTVILLVPLDMGGAVAEIEVTDGGSGERVLALACAREGTPFLLIECFSRYGHARHAFAKWSELLAELLAESYPPTVP